MAGSLPVFLKGRKRTSFWKSTFRSSCPRWLAQWQLCRTIPFLHRCRVEEIASPCLEWSEHEGLSFPLHLPLSAYPAGESSLPPLPTVKFFSPTRPLKDSDGWESFLTFISKNFNGVFLKIAFWPSQRRPWDQKRWLPSDLGWVPQQSSSWIVFFESY